jgi:hypothetical protein
MVVIDASPEVESRPFLRRRVDLSITFREKKTAFIPFSSLSLHCTSPHAQLDGYDLSAERTTRSESAKRDGSRAEVQQK